MSQTEQEFKNIIAHCKEYGFVFPSSEIYDGLSAVYDYGQTGAALKKNLKDYWWKSMVQLHENIVGIDSAIFMHPKTWKASGHIDGFNDPMIDNKDSKKRYRADVLIEEYIDKIQAKIDKEVSKAAKRFGDSFDEKQYLATNPRVLDYTEKIADTNAKMKHGLEGDLPSLKKLIEDLEIACPMSGSKNWTDVKQFNLMYSTQMNATSTEGDDALYLRPETAQGIFVNYLNVQKTGRMKVPFGIAQIGKAFRNEIVARQFIIRMKEFEQMELQFFVRPGTEMEVFEYWKKTRLAWHQNLGIKPVNYRYHDHVKLAHYANAAVDIEYKFPFGFKEVEGIHSRTDFDLKAHQEMSGKKLQYFDPELEESYVPYVVETSIGVDRLFLLVISEALEEETLEGGDTRTVLRLHPAIAPYKMAILPLLKKDGLPEKAREIYHQLKYDFECYYEEKDAIGKRYRRQDAIGTPYCITVDHDSLNDNMVTIRDRDTMEQRRVLITELSAILHQATDMSTLLKGLEG